MARLAVFVLVLALIVPAAELPSDVPQLFCQPGGFVVSRFGGAVQVQPKAGASFNVFFDAAAYQSNAFDAALRAAMSSWSTVDGSAWSYNFAGYSNAAPSGSDGQMTVVRGGQSFPPGVLAVTIFRGVGSTGELIDSDIFFNSNAPITTSPGAGEYDFQSIALHEMGHGLGLDHNDACLPTPTVMHSTIGGAVQRRSLLPAEVEGVRFLYPGSPSGGGGGGGGSGGGILSASPSSLLFSGTVGAAVPPTRTLSISGSSGAWSAVASTDTGGDWLRLSPDSGTLPVVLEASVLTGGLGPGTYTGRIHITAGTSAADVSVSLNLSPPPANIVQASPASLLFEALRGAASTPQDVRLTGSGGASWRATAVTTSGGPWLTPSPDSGTLPSTLVVFVSPGGLNPGVYSGRIVVTSGDTTREIPVQVEVASQSRLVLAPAQFSFTAPAGSTALVCSSLRIAGFAGALLDWTATPSASWLAVNPGSGRSPASTTVCANPAGLAAGNYSAQLAVAAPSLSSTQNVLALLTVAPPVTFGSSGVVNAASFANQPLTAGQIVSLFGANLASQTAQATTFPLLTDLGGTRVTIAGVPARLLYVSSGQINLVTPSGLTGSTASLSVSNGSVSSPPVVLPVAHQSPGMFTVLGNGVGAGAITHVDFSLVTRAAPLAAGEPFSVYLTGLGPLDSPVADGAPAPTDPLARATNSVRVLVDGQEASLYFAGAAPGFAGLQVVIATAPATLARRFPEMVVEVGGVPSNRFTAGGPSLLDVTPPTVRTGADARLTLRGVNLPASAGVQVAGQALPASLADGPLQTLSVTLPAALLASPGPLALTVIDTSAPGEPASNPVTLTVGSVAP